MQILKNKLGYELPIRTEKDFPVKGIEFIDINPLLMDSNIYNDIIDQFINELAEKRIDYIISPEARGFILGCPVAVKAKIPFIPVRKKGKLPPTTIEIEMEYEKEYGKDILCLPKLSYGTYTNKNIYILDDIYATGNTSNAIARGIKSLGGNVVGVGTLINIIELNNDNVFSIIDVKED